MLSNHSWRPRSTVCPPPTAAPCGPPRCWALRFEKDLLARRRRGRRAARRRPVGTPVAVLAAKRKASSCSRTRWSATPPTKGFRSGNDACCTPGRHRPSRNAPRAPPLAVELLSLHWLAAERWDRAWECARLAGERASALYANADAATQFGRALDAASHLRRGAAGGRWRAWANCSETSASWPATTNGRVPLIGTALPAAAAMAPTGPACSGKWAYCKNAGAATPRRCATIRALSATSTGD